MRAAPEHHYLIARHVHVGDVLCRPDGARGQVVAIEARPGVVRLELVGGSAWYLEADTLLELEHRPW